jgi:hypothetical protein
VIPKDEFVLIVGKDQKVMNLGKGGGPEMVKPIFPPNTLKGSPGDARKGKSL